ncbi:MAG: hypothetical protein HUU50_15645 [Candidatus Brocadiae bacterium]|nr:hypothetical protein [Candidatus Brocadiia bacterium]
MMWVPHETRGNAISIRPDFYPASEDWGQKHSVYFEWTHPKLIKHSSHPLVESDTILQELALELGEDMEEEIEKIRKALRARLKEVASSRCYELMELLSEQGYSNLLAEQKLRAISIGLFGE